jgi:hypothetical protein
MEVALGADAAFEPKAPTPLFETRLSNGLINTSFTRNQYVVTSDGQRFLLNQSPATAPAMPIAVTVNWPATITR